MDGSPPASTAAVLSNSDLLLEIFEYLAPFPEPLTLLPRATPPIELPKESSLRRRALLSAALTCRAFAEPASSVLWRVLYNGLLALLCPFSAFTIGPQEENWVTSSLPHETISPAIPRKRSAITSALKTGAAQLSRLVKYISCSTSGRTTRRTYTIWDQDQGPRRISQARTSSEALSLMLYYNTTCILEGTATPAEWVRWKHCVHRVRFLVLNHTWASLLKRPFIPFLLQGANPGEPLLPCLQSLAFNDTRGDLTQMQLLRALMPSHTLSEVMVLTEIPNSFSAHLSRDLEAISEFCENVQTIALQGLYWLPLDLPLSRFRRLRVLHVTMTSWIRGQSWNIAQMGALEELQEFRIHFWHPPVNEAASDLRDQHSSATNDHPPNASAGRFPALQRLDISGMVHEITLVLSSISSTSLQDVQIYSIQDTLAEVSTLVLAFPWRNNASSLRRLSIYLSIEVYPVEDNLDRADVPFLDLFAPLADMHALEGLEVTAWNRLLALPDTTVAQMAQAWPLLQHLHIACNPWFQYALPDAALPSLLALVRLVERCPALAYCELNVASVSVADLEVLEVHAADPGRVPQTNLEQLVPAWLTHNERFTVPDIERIAQVLRALFPSIAGVGEPDPNDVGWRRMPWRRATRTSWSEEHQEMDAFRLLGRLNELAGKRKA